MSLDKAIAHGKEHRRPYRGAARFDPACRNGTCPWCASNKRHARRRREDAAEATFDDNHPYLRGRTIEDE